MAYHRAKDKNRGKLDGLTNRPIVDASLRTRYVCVLRIPYVHGACTYTHT
jgi:hypothetical protein